MSAEGGDSTTVRGEPGVAGMLGGEVGSDEVYFA